MNLRNSISANMEYIQKTFLGVQEYLQANHKLEELITFLDAEPPLFRSVVYESASMEIGLQELTTGRDLNSWKYFYHHSAKAHTFHIHIGLGWAFAKTEVSPTPFLESMGTIMQSMVFDGMGYYNGLFKGRRTVKNQIVPVGINEQELHGFDQGLGRRLWYIVKGDVNELVELIKPFHSSRYPDLWRGVGIACGYVGGSSKENLERLLNSSNQNKEQLSAGIALAAISRNSSDSVTEDIKLACEIICGMSMQEILNPQAGILNNIIRNCGLSFNLNILTKN